MAATAADAKLKLQAEQQQHSHHHPAHPLQKNRTVYNQTRREEKRKEKKGEANSNGDIDGVLAEEAGKASEISLS
uniref:Uncharacterized protein n=1 Tax=Oryza punctata TaxID=4537 RepID=A0A0E0L1B2_ORYPU